MHRSSHRLRGRVAVVALLATLAFSIAPTALADDWARDRAAVGRAIDGLDPAIRTAVVARVSSSPPTVSPVATSAPVDDGGFAWGAAAVGLGAGIAGMCVLLGCVTLVRHDGRLRSA